MSRSMSLLTRLVSVLSRLTLSWVVVLFAICVSGCTLGKHPPESPPTGQAAGTGSTNGGDAPASSVFDRPAQRMTIEFNVHRVSAPRGTFDDKSDLWRIINGQLPDADSVLKLAANGFRAALGRESDRQALVDYLKSVPEPLTVPDHAIPDVSRMVEIEIGPCAPLQSVFYYDERGGLHGMEFQDAKAKFNIAFEIRAAELSEVWLKVIPELEEPPSPPKWEISEDGHARQVPQLRQRMFDEIAFLAKIPEGGLLVLGPTQSVYDQPLLGRPFFVQLDDKDPVDGKMRESIYIINPVIRTGSNQGSASTASTR